MYFSRVLLLLQSIALVVLLSACSSGGVVKTYEGDVLPQEQIATLLAPENIELVSVNGKRVPRYLLSSINVNYALKPGVNVVVFEYGSVWSRSAMGGKEKKRATEVESEQREVLIDAVAGERYSFEFERPESFSQAKVLAASFEADVIKLSDMSVVARSGDLGVNAVPGAVASVEAKAGSVAVERDVAAVSCAPVPESAPKEIKVCASESLVPLEGLKSNWDKASAADKKAFMKWAFN